MSCLYRSQRAEVFIMRETSANWQRNKPVFLCRLRVGVSASVQTFGSICGMEGDRISTWTEDRVRLSLFLTLRESKLTGMLHLVDVTAEATLTAAAQKEITYLKHFGKPILPFQRIRREAYNYEKQSPLDHIHNLERFLLIASSIIPKDPALQSFGIRHPDMRPNNIMISRSPESGEPKIVSLIDWQHASILPRFCLTSVPEDFRNDGDPFSRHLVLPSSPNLEEMEGPELMYAKRTHLARLVYHHYVKYTETLNKFNDLNRAFQDPAFVLTLHLIDQSGAPWEGETHGLKELLIEAAERWETTAGAEVPCPIHFDPEDVAKTKAFDKRMQTADDNYRGVQFMLGFQSETWVPLEEYDLIKAEAEILKKTVFDDLSSDEEREQCRPHWLFDDMDEEDYM